MSDFKRQHVIAAVARALALIRGNIVAILVLLFVGSRGESSVIWWIGGGFVTLLVLGFMSWWRFRYKVEDGQLHIKRGLLVRQNLYLTRDRVQVIDVTAGILQRMFGLVKIEIKTAASSSREATIDAVTREEADEISEMLKKENGKPEATDESLENIAQKDLKKKYYLPGKDLLIAASTSGSFGIALSVVGTVFSQIEPLLSENEMYEWITTVIPSQTDTAFILSLIIALVVFAWLMSFFGTLFTYGDFQLTVREDQIVITRGIFEKKRITIPFNRIQSIWINEGVFRQPFGYCSVHLESAGYGDERGSGSIVLFPLIKKSRLNWFLEQVVPEYQKTAPAIRPPIRALGRYIFRSVVVAVPVIAGLQFLFDASSWIWMLMLFAGFWGWLRYQDAAIGWDHQFVMISNRFISKSTAFVKKKRSQDLDLRQSRIQEIRDLITVKIHVASGDHGRSFHISDLDGDISEYLEKWIRKNQDSMSEEVSPQSGVVIPSWNLSLNGS